MKVFFVTAVMLTISVSNCAIAQIETQGALTTKELREQRMQKVRELQKRIQEKRVRAEQEQGKRTQVQAELPSQPSQPSQSKSSAQNQALPQLQAQSQQHSQSQTQWQSTAQAIPQWGTPKQQRPKISLDDRNKYKLSAPAAGSTYTAGESLQIEPIVQSPRGSKSVLVKYYLQGAGSTRLVSCQGWDWCGTGRRRGGLADGILHLLSYSDGDRDEIKPGSYSLVITQGEHRSSLGSERVIATSDRFTIQANPNARPQIQQPTSSIHGPMSKDYHHTGKLLDRLQDYN